MPSNYRANDPYVNEQVDLDDVFITDAWLLDQFVGGTLFAWGSGAWGNMGIGAAGPQGFVYYSSPIQVGALTNWKQVACATSATGAVKTDGTLWMWGQGDYGQIGNGTSATYSSPIQIGSLTNWKQVSLGQFHTAAVKTNGTLWTWGAGTQNYGQLGNGTTWWYSSPIQVGLLTNWKQVTGRGNATVAIKTDGTLWAWGYNYFGELGNGTTINYSSPIQVGSLTNWKQVADTVAIKTDGTLWAWGSNIYGQLGLYGQSSAALFNTVAKSSPVQVAGGATWANTDPDTKILTVNGDASGSTGLIDYNNNLWVFGSNSYGELGDGTTVDKYSPIQVGTSSNWSQVACSYNTAAVKTDGTLWGWGYNNYGQIGNGTTVSYSSPIQVGSLTNWKQVSTAASTNYPFTAAIKTDGTLWTWGHNARGQLGNGTVNVYYSSPIQVGSLTTWKQVSCSTWMRMAMIKTDGTLWTCGYNYAGALGLGLSNSYLSYSSPVQVGLLTNWKQVVCGQYHTAAVKTDGTLWVWGSNSDAITTYGQLGDNGTYKYVSSPIQVGSLNTWKQAIAGFHSTGAIKTDGTLWTWGRNDGGQLGNGTVNVHYSSPIQVGSLTNWKQAFFANYGAIGAYKSDGTVWISGVGPLGSVSSYTNPVSSPVQVGSLTSWKQVFSGGSFTAAIQTDGTLWTWGRNSAGQLGNGTTINYSSPIQVGSLTNWKQVTCGAEHTAAVKTDGTLWTWGQNSASTGGQLGNGTTITYSSPIQVGSLTNWKQVAGFYTTFAITFKDIG